MTMHVNVQNCSEIRLHPQKNKNKIKICQDIMIPVHVPPLL